MSRYLLNSPVLAQWGRYRFDGPLPLADARRFADGELTSAVGHSATAALLCRLLDCNVPVTRRYVVLAPGEQALVFRLLQRLPEGRVLDANQLAKTRWEFGLLTREA